MLSVPVMTEVSDNCKRNVPAVDYVLNDEQVTATAAGQANNSVQVSDGIRSQISINELGKQLLKAAGDGNLEEVKTLMAKGAAFTADWLGTTPLHLAAQKNHLEICEILLRAGISKDARTKVDRTPLHMAVYEGHMEIVETLLSLGADVDCKDMLLMTPLHWAAQNCHAAIADLLIKYGAATDLVNKFKLTPIDIAKQMGRQDIVQIIMTGKHDPLLVPPLGAGCNSDSNCSNNDDEREGEGDYDDDDDDGDDESLNPELCTPVETVLLEDDEETTENPPILNTNNPENNYSTISPSYHNDLPEPSLEESLKILQQHGITMLPSEEHNILSSAVASGHAVVLTEVGKQMLDSVKAAEAAAELLPKMGFSKTRADDESKKIVTISPEEFFALTGSNAANQLSVTKHVNNNGKTVENSPKRGLVKKSKINATTQNAAKIPKIEHPTDMETVMKQLIEARNIIEEYKIKLKKKEAEAEKYKRQLKVLLGEK